LLLTDGEDHESEPIEAAKQAAKLGIRIYAVGIGSASGEVIPQLNEDGSISEQKITTGLAGSTGTIEITSGLAEGQKVVIDNRQLEQ
jgi:Ca-activated chloride channel family protein